jgi:glutathione S-transferase
MAHSPFCIPIARILEASGVPFERREIPNWDRSELLRLTDGAYYAVPILVHGDDIVWDADESIAAYLDRKVTSGRLFPPHLAAAQDCIVDFIEQQLEDRTFKLVDIHYIPSITDVAHRGMVIRHKERKFGRGCLDAWRRDASHIRAEADRLLARFETTLRLQPFLLGKAPVYADFLLHGILGNLTYHGWNTLHESQTALRDWHCRMAAFIW